MATKILLIEDDMTVRENTAEILELSDYQVQTASDGLKGVEEVERFQPDIIVCDIMMPELMVMAFWNICQNHLQPNPFHLSF